MQYRIENISQHPTESPNISGKTPNNLDRFQKCPTINSKESGTIVAELQSLQHDADLQARRRAHASRFATFGLTPAEADIAAALVLGGRARVCADNRRITMNTLRTLRRRAYDKLGVADQVELMQRWAILPEA